MSIHFHKLLIKEIKRETPDCISILFDVPESLRETFRFHHGQNITLRETIEGEELRRSYSICSAPHENELKVAVKRAENGIFSTWANKKLKAGLTIEVLPPTGKFYTELNSKHQKKYLALAAGSGITPILSIIKSVLRTEPKSECTLVYGNKNTNSIIFKEEIEGLKNLYMERLNLIYILSREKTEVPIFTGRINPDKLKDLGKIIDWKTMDEIFLCGPEEMIFTVSDYLQQQGISQKKIHFELFTTPGQTHGVPSKRQFTESSDEPKSTVTIKLDGRIFEFELGFNSEGILDAALKQGADLPFSCKGGVCGTCRAKLLEGKVNMDANYALEPEEVAAGFILTCQSHPTTDKVVVDYDAR